MTQGELKDRIERLTAERDWYADVRSSLIDRVASLRVELDVTRTALKAAPVPMVATESATAATVEAYIDWWTNECALALNPEMAKGE